jgi:WD40 repeat protein
MGDELASFPTNDSILTGGTDISIRNLGNGQILSSQQTGGLPAHTVWAVPDLRESFYLCREKLRFDEPAELSIQSGDLIRDQFQFQQFPGRRFRYQDTMTEQTGLRPTREGLRTESVAMNFARTQLAAAFHDDPALAAPKHSLVLYQVKTTEEFELVPVGEAVSAPGGRVSALGFARNGKTLASGGDDGTVCLWDVGDEIGPWKPRVTIEPVGNSRVSAVAFTRDWRMVAAVTWDKTKPNLLLIDADAGKLLASVHLTGMLNSVTFSPDCKTVLTGSADGKIRAWDIAELLKGETATGQAKQIPVK